WLSRRAGPLRRGEGGVTRNLVLGEQLPRPARQVAAALEPISERQASRAVRSRVLTPASCNSRVHCTVLLPAPVPGCTSGLARHVPAHFPSNRRRVSHAEASSPGSTAGV